jgi:hypothetical protein
MLIGSRLWQPSGKDNVSGQQYSILLIAKHPFRSEARDFALVLVIARKISFGFQATWRQGCVLHNTY